MTTDNIKASLFLDHVINEDNECLIGWKCDRCDKVYFPQRHNCIHCYDALVPCKLSKFGTLYTYTTIYQSNPIFNTPYSVGYIDLSDGVRIFSLLVLGTFECFAVGMKMVMVVERFYENKDKADCLVYKFKPIDSMGDQ